MKFSPLAITASVFVLGLVSAATAAPVRMTCTENDEDYGVYFDPASKILVIDKDEGFFHPHMAAHQWKVRKVSRAGGGYKITASGGPSGPHINVYTGAVRKVEYTEYYLGSVFETDPCR
jgi:hypothetical protein